MGLLSVQLFYEWQATIEIIIARYSMRYRTVIGVAFAPWLHVAIDVTHQGFLARPSLRRSHCKVRSDTVAIRCSWSWCAGAPKRQNRRPTDA